AAAAAVHLGAHHAVAVIVGLFDGAGHRVVEARPAGAALEFLLRHEQRLLAAGAAEGTGALLVVECAAAGCLGAMLAHDVILLSRERLAPFRISAGEGILLGVHGASPGFGRTHM